MAERVIELNDAGLVLADGADLRVESPGFAIVDDRQLVVGEPARRAARINPRQTTSQFWLHLSTDPLPHPAAGARTHADLAFAHLQHLWELAGGGDGEVLLAIPGHYDRQQMGLLLGIIAQCPFEAVGLVDAAVAAVSAEAGPQGPVLHLDAMLHQAVITRLHRKESVEREAVDDLAAAGLQPLMDAWVNLIADQFIRETRFDPLHHAASEQHLYDRLPEWLATLRDFGELAVELTAGNSVHRVTVQRAHLVERARPRYAELIGRLRQNVGSEGHPEMLVSHRLAALPGLLDSLTEAGFHARELAADASVRGALRHAALIRRKPGALAFVTRLPSAGDQTVTTAASTPAAPAPGAEAPPRVEPEVAPGQAPPSAPGSTSAVAAQTATTGATHVLVGSDAYPLSTDALRIGGPAAPGTLTHPELTGPAAHLLRQEHGWRLEALDDAPLEVNGQARAGALLRPGQIAHVGEAEIRVELIRIVPGQEAD